MAQFFFLDLKVIYCILIEIQGVPGLSGRNLTAVSDRKCAENFIQTQMYFYFHKVMEFHMPPQFFSKKLHEALKIFVKLFN